MLKGERHSLFMGESKKFYGVSFLSGGISALCTKTVVAPLERLKLLKQSQVYYKDFKYGGLFNSFKYIKNNEGEQLILGEFFLIAEATTGGSPDMFRVNWYKNPTSISSGTALSPLNQNFGSSEQLNTDIEYGAEGSTVTGGSLAATLSFPIGGFNSINANLILEKGSSLVISIDPPAGNSSMPVQFGTRSIKYIQRY